MTAYRLMVIGAPLKALRRCWSGTRPLQHFILALAWVK